MPKFNSGKGYSAVFGSNNMNLNNSNTDKIAIELIDTNPYQPRLYFDPEKLSELAESIKKHGVIQPILVRPKGDRYELIAGERRFRASKLAGELYIPANIKDMSDKESLEIALIENIQREDINAVETAFGYRKLMDEFAYTQENLSFVIGKSRSAIANTLRLLNLSESILDLIRNKKISEGHGRCILSVPEDYREEFAKRIIDKKLSVRQAEDEAVNYKETLNLDNKEIKMPTESEKIPYNELLKKENLNFLMQKLKFPKKKEKEKL